MHDIANLIGWMITGFWIAVGVLGSAVIYGLIKLIMHLSIKWKA